MSHLKEDALAMSASVSKRIRKNAGIPSKNKQRKSSLIKSRQKRASERFHRMWMESVAMGYIEDTAYAEDTMWEFRHSKPGDMVPMTDRFDGDDLF